MHLNIKGNNFRSPKAHLLRQGWHSAVEGIFTSILCSAWLTQVLFYLNDLSAAGFICSKTQLLPETRSISLCKTASTLSFWNTHRIEEVTEERRNTSTRAHSLPSTLGEALKNPNLGPKHCKVLCKNTPPNKPENH